MLTLRTIRAKLGLTQPMMAYAMGVHLTTVLKWERDLGSPMIENLLYLQEFARTKGMYISDKELLDIMRNRKSYQVFVQTRQVKIQQMRDMYEKKEGENNGKTE